jgi:hypothetical protein
VYGPLVLRSRLRGSDSPDTWLTGRPEVNCRNQAFTLIENRLGRGVAVLLSHPDSANPPKQLIPQLGENLRMSVLLELERLLDPNGPRFLGRGSRKLLKDMVGTGRLGLLTSAVSRSGSAVTD